MLPEIVKSKIVRSKLPPCQHSVRVSDYDTLTKRRRQDETRRAGIPTDQCGMPGGLRRGRRAARTPLRPP